MKKVRRKVQIRLGLCITVKNNKVKAHVYTLRKRDK